MAVDQREYLIFEDVGEDPELKALFDAAVAAVLDGSAIKSMGKAKDGYATPDCLRVEDRDLLDYDVLEYYLREQATGGFSYREARNFTELMRKLLGWQRISYVLKSWVERCLRDPNLINLTPDVRYESMQEWVIDPEVQVESISPELYEYACYIAIAHMKFGPSYASVTAQRIFDYVTILGSDLPQKLKKSGSGELPAALSEYKEGEVCCRANDAFATIKITIKSDGEEQYSQVLDYLCRLLRTDFPRSYAISFKGPNKHYLDIVGLPKKGAHALFAGAAKYPRLYPKIEAYARLAMRKFEWYTDLEAENCALPGTFAVFALGLTGKEYVPLVIEYLELCDDEHQSIQARFVKGLVAKHGLDENSMEIFLAGVLSMQEFPHNKLYRDAIARRESLESLLRAKTRFDSYDWQRILYALWGEKALSNSTAILKTVPQDLRSLYVSILESDDN